LKRLFLSFKDEREKMNANEHAKLLGLFMWIYAGLQGVFVLVFGGIYLLLFGAIGIEAASKGGRKADEAAMVFGIVVAVILVLMVIGLIALIPKLVAGYGLRKGKSWAKIWTIIACILMVMAFPLGTAVGVYGLWFTFGDMGKIYFEGQNPNRFYPPQTPRWQ
jgi:hypothetical protein